MPCIITSCCATKSNSGKLPIRRGAYSNTSAGLVRVLDQLPGGGFVFGVHEDFDASVFGAEVRGDDAAEAFVFEHGEDAVGFEHAFDDFGFHPLSGEYGYEPALVLVFHGFRQLGCLVFFNQMAAFLQRVAFLLSLREKLRLPLLYL